jgi:hypothetical protein
MEIVLYLSIVTASVSFTVTETKLFKPFRIGLSQGIQSLGSYSAAVIVLVIGLL